MYMEWKKLCLRIRGLPRVNRDLQFHCSSSAVYLALVPLFPPRADVAKLGRGGFGRAERGDEVVGGPLLVILDFDNGPIAVRKSDGDES